MSILASKGGLWRDLTDDGEYAIINTNKISIKLMEIIL